MDHSLYILGRQPALGLAELESLYGAAAVTPAGLQAAVVARPPAVEDFSRLGGSLKMCRVLETLDTTDPEAVLNHLQKGRHLLTGLPEAGKITLGLSAYGWPVRRERLLAAGLTLKKTVRAMGHAVRLVPIKEGTALSSAQVIHNGLTGPAGLELVLVRADKQTIIAAAAAGQDIAAYTRRDRERPMRDAKVGMLPPKLAQIILNLATAADPGVQSVLDPFCGTGVILQEASLMGYGVVGTDLEPRMIDYSRANLTWLAEWAQVAPPIALAAGDATALQWEPVADAIATETYLGRAFTQRPDKQALTQVIKACELITRKFLRNIHSQLTPGTRLCLAVPAWQTAPGRFEHLPLLDGLDSLGYNRISFAHVQDTDLVYARTDQTVARQLLVIRRK